MNRPSLGARGVRATQFRFPTLWTIEQAAVLGLFLLAGTIGHDPWKQDETYTFGIVYHFLTTHSWLIPVDAGLPFMEKPPLYYWTAVIFCKIFGGFLALPDAARLASVFYTVVTAVFGWRLSQIVFGGREDRNVLGWLTLALLLGSAGVIRHIHDMFSDVALLSGSTIALYGMALLFVARTDWRRAGFWIGLGVGVSFLSKGFFTPTVLFVAGLAVYAACADVRRRETWFAVAMAFVVASPFLIIWPALLYGYSRELFMQWFWENNVGRFLGFSVSTLGAGNPPFYIWKVAALFAFPSFPIGCVYAFTRKRDEWRKPGFALPVATAAVGLLLLTFSASARALYLLPLVPSFALLAAGGAAALPAKLHARWNVGVRSIFTFALAAVWLVWSSLSGVWAGRPIGWLAKIYERWIPSAPLAGAHHWALAAAVALSILWLLSFRLEAGLAKNTARIWIAGIAAVWGVTFTLLLPWMDETRSYQGTLSAMVEASRGSPYGAGCIGMTRFDESISPMVEYFTRRFRAYQRFDQTGCPILIEKDLKETPVADHPRWRLLWRGHRPLDAKDEELRLYVESTPPALDPDADGDVDGAKDDDDRFSAVTAFERPETPVPAIAKVQKPDRMKATLH